MTEVGVEGMLKEESRKGRRKKKPKKKTLESFRQRVFCKKLQNRYTENGEE